MRIAFLRLDYAIIFLRPEWVGGAGRSLPGEQPAAQVWRHLFPVASLCCQPSGLGGTGRGVSLGSTALGIWHLPDSHVTGSARVASAPGATLRGHHPVHQAHLHPGTASRQVKPGHVGLGRPHAAACEPSFRWGECGAGRLVSSSSGTQTRSCHLSFASLPVLCVSRVSVQCTPASWRAAAPLARGSPGSRLSSSFLVSIRTLPLLSPISGHTVSLPS